MTKLTVSTIISAPLDKVWEAWVSPEQVTAWNAASDDWHCPSATNDLQVGGAFCYRMSARDGSLSFDFEGAFTEIIERAKIGYKILDGRQVEVTFTKTPEGINVTETFEAESAHSIEMQQAGWQAILENFKKHVESSLNT